MCMREEEGKCNKMNDEHVRLHRLARAESVDIERAGRVEAFDGGEEEKLDNKTSLDLVDEYSSGLGWQITKIGKAKGHVSS